MTLTIEQRRERKRLLQREWVRANPERVNEINRRSRERNKLRWAANRYAMSVVRLSEMYEAQGGVCAICREPETKVGRGGTVQILSIDHDHKTGRVRGLLCDSCNRAIGSFDHDVERLAAAVDYLREVQR